jgi:hypothetical protein
MFLILPYTMGLANVMLILIGLMCLSPKNVSTTMSIINNVIGSLEQVFRYETKSCSMHFSVVPGETRKYL